jgi:hypothetical protein
MRFIQNSKESVLSRWLFFCRLFNGGPRVEAGYNTSTVALGVVAGYEKGSQCLGV